MTYAIDDGLGNIINDGYPTKQDALSDAKDHANVTGVTCQVYEVVDWDGDDAPDCSMPYIVINPDIVVERHGAPAYSAVAFGSISSLDLNAAWSRGNDDGCGMPGCDCATDRCDCDLSEMPFGKRIGSAGDMEVYVRNGSLYGICDSHGPWAVMLRPGVE